MPILDNLTSLTKRDVWLRIILVHVEYSYGHEFIVMCKRASPRMLSCTRTVLVPSPYVVEAAARVLEHRLHSECGPLQQRAGPLAPTLPHRDRRAAARQRGPRADHWRLRRRRPVRLQRQRWWGRGADRTRLRARLSACLRRRLRRHSRMPAHSQSRGTTGCRPLAPVARARNPLRRVLQYLWLYRADHCTFLSCIRVVLYHPITYSTVVKFYYCTRTTYICTCTVISILLVY